MSRLLEGKTAVVTGANRGLGRAILLKLAEHGARVYACARTENPEFEADLEAVSQRCGVEIYPIYFDMCDSEGMKAGVKKMKRYGHPIDILVNNAGMLSEYQRFNMMDMAGVRKLFDVNFFGQMELTQLVSRLMQRNNRGSIVYISSIAAMDAFFSSFDYVACKAAINGAMKQQARELGAFNIRVNAIAPGLVETDMIKGSDKGHLEAIVPAIVLGRFGKPEEIADSVVFFASDLSTYVTGQVLRVDGGTTPPRANW